MQLRGQVTRPLSHLLHDRLWSDASDEHAARVAAGRLVTILGGQSRHGVRGEGARASGEDGRHARPQLVLNLWKVDAHLQRAEGGGQGEAGRERRAERQVERRSDKAINGSKGASRTLLLVYRCHVASEASTAA